MKKIQEKKIIKKLKQGDEQAFEWIYDQYVDRIYRFVFLKVNVEEKTQEIVQDVFLKFWKTASEDKTRINNVAALLYRIARFNVIDYYRSKARKQDEISIESGIIDQELTVDIEIDKHIDIKYDLEKIKLALVDLPQIYKDVIIMKFIDELSNKEIAQILNKRASNVGVIIHRALKTLRKNLNAGMQS